MRVLYFTRDYSPHDHRFLTALAKTEHEVFSLRLERRHEKREERPLPVGIQPVEWKGGAGPVGWRQYPGLVRDLKQVLTRIQPNLVHAGTVQTAAFLTALAGYHPLVTMSWGSDLLRDADRSRGMRLATRYTLDRTDVLLGDCLAVQDKAAEFGFRRERSVIFPWGVDLDLFQPGDSPIRAQLGWQHDFVLLSLRAWEPIYGVDVLLKGFLRAARSAPALRLILLGGGSQGAMLRELVEQSGMKDRVHMSGLTRYRDLPDYYRAADLYVSASYSDGSSVSLLEALACARPALVSDIPGNREWVQEGEHGWFFPSGDEKALASAILRAYEQRTALAVMGRRCRELAEQRADWNKNVQKLLAAYELAASLKDR